MNYWQKHPLCIYAHTKDDFAHYDDYKYTFMLASM